MQELNLIITFLLKPLSLYLNDNVITKEFDLELSNMLISCIIILVINIFMSLCFLVIMQKFILSETLENVENLNIIIRMLN